MKGLKKRILVATVLIVAACCNAEAQSKGGKQKSIEQELMQLQFDQNMDGHTHFLPVDFQYLENLLPVSCKFPHQKIHLDIQQDSRDG